MTKMLLYIYAICAMGAALAMIWMISMIAIILGLL
jgi:hypothetical protein